MTEPQPLNPAAVARGAERLNELASHILPPPERAVVLRSVLDTYERGMSTIGQDRDE